MKYRTFILIRQSGILPLVSRLGAITGLEISNTYIHEQASGGFVIVFVENAQDNYQEFLFFFSFEGRLDRLQNNGFIGESNWSSEISPSDIAQWQRNIDALKKASQKRNDDV